VNTALVTLGWTDQQATAFAPYAADHLPGRVTRVDRGAVDLMTGEGDATVTPLRARTTSGTAVVAGDWVAVAHDSVGPVVGALLPRRTAIERAAASGHSSAQVLAANVDIVLIVMPAFPEPKAPLVERLVALAWDSGATPLIAVTKSDLTPETDAIVADLAETAPGVDVVAVSALADDGVGALAPYLQAGRTLCLVGRSGAGKSTLANALLGHEQFATGDVRRDGKGRHTTTHRELVVLPGGGVLLDTPGLRGAGLWVGDEGLDRTFADVEEFVEQCRFSDCGHESEPGCAVLAAVDDGRLTQRRLDSWRKLQREARWMASRNDSRLKAEQRRQWKIVTMEYRRSQRVRP
jgi:ribosome biogenesis GTPase / thiamine phosphate phosphatase